MFRWLKRIFESDAHERRGYNPGTGLYHGRGTSEDSTPPQGTPQGGSGVSPKLPKGASPTEPVERQRIPARVKKDKTQVKGEEGWVDWEPWMRDRYILNFADPNDVIRHTFNTGEFTVAESSGDLSDGFPVQGSDYPDGD